MCIYAYKFVSFLSICAETDDCLKMTEKSEKTSKKCKKYKKIHLKIDTLGRGHDKIAMRNRGNFFIYLIKWI